MIAKVLGLNQATVQRIIKRTLASPDRMPQKAQNQLVKVQP